MYLSHFNLAEAPFSIAPNPRYLYLSQQHQEALAHLLYGLQGEGGFVLLTGEVGAGKTTVCRRLLEKIPLNCDLAYIFNPKLSVVELLLTICTEFGIDCPTEPVSIKVYVDHINHYLLNAHAHGRHAVLIIDEAQNLSAEVLEQMRLLTNLETNERKLLQIILLGQPELTEMLMRPELRQLAQRIVARYHLGPLNTVEVAAYVRHRLKICGTQEPLIPEALMGRIYRLTRGIPRLINVLCDRALLGAYTQGKPRVDRGILEQAAREVLQAEKPKQIRFSWLGLGGVLFVLGALWLAQSLGLNLNLRAETEKLGVGKTVGQRDSSFITAQFESMQPLTWPTTQVRERSQQQAYASVFKAWGAEYHGADPCAQASFLGLLCRSEQGDLKLLRQLNRPVVLSLRDAQGQIFHAALLSLNEMTATLVLGQEKRVVGIEDLKAHWTGAYSMFLREPPASREKVRIGTRGPIVRWVVQQLAQIHHRPLPLLADDLIFTAAMAAEVKEFQRQQGLFPDGRPGVQTRSSLSAVADRESPRLWQAAEGR